ncbi:MAG: hypothetical protein NZ824_11615 [Candidatus Thioglobus sp.]|nr:hypothetical protein [Candidatus Thioglobus sp.]
MGYYYRHPSAIEPTADEMKDYILTKILSRDFDAAIVDRTGTLNNFCEILTPIPEESLEDLEFNNVVDNRAKEIVDNAIANDKEVRILWDSGLTSSMIFLAISKYRDTVDPDFVLKIFPTFKSQERWHGFYDEIILKTPNIEIHEPKGSTAWKNTHQLMWSDGDKDGKLVNYTVVTPDLTDPLLGPRLMLKKDFESLNKPHEKVFNPDILCCLESIISEMPARLGEKTAGNVLNWLNFVFSWQWNLLRRWMNSPAKRENISIFYDSDSFQQWFLQTPLIEKWPDVGNDVLQNSWHVREYIRQYYDDFVLGKKEYIQQLSIQINTPIDVPPPLREDRDNNSIWTGITTDFVKEQKVIEPIVIDQIDEHKGE